LLVYKGLSLKLSAPTIHPPLLVTTYKFITNLINLLPIYISYGLYLYLDTLYLAYKNIRLIFVFLILIVNYLKNFLNFES